MRIRLTKSFLELGALLGHGLARELKWLNEAQFWSREQLREHQNQALRLLIRHCYENVPYYRDLMQSRRLRPEDIRRVEHLAYLPCLTRDVIREEADRLRATNYPNRVCLLRRSGGTTGEPIQVAVDRRCRAIETAALLRGLEWMGHRLGTPTVRLSGGSLGLQLRPSLRAHVRTFVLNTRFLPAFEINGDNVGRYASVLSRAMDGTLIGYSSAVMNLVELLSKSRIEIGNLARVICTADQLPDSWRQRIGSALNASVYAYYGCGEVNSLGFECAGESGYLVPGEHVVLEAATSSSCTFNDEGRGEACITALYNYAMPLIRYLNSDIIELGPAGSHRPHSRILRLEGRVMDQLVRNDGSRVSGAFVPHLVKMTGCQAWKYQLVQTALDRFVFHYLTQDGEQLEPSMREAISQTLERHLGDEVRVEFVVGEFEASSSHKHRFVINHIDRR